MHISPKSITLTAPALLLLMHGCGNSTRITNENENQPNILWITNEDMSPRLGAYGDEIVSTPNLDKFFSQSIQYTNAFGVTGVCAPNRSCLITGMYPTSYGAQHMRTVSRTSALDKITDPELLAIPTYEAVPPVGAVTYAELFRRAGYYTTNNSKTDYQFRPPITAWDESSNTAHWRNRPDKDQPFFSVFNITMTHESRVWANADMPILVDPDDIEVPPYYPDTEIVRRDMAIHYSNIIRMDSIAGIILNQLEEDGLADNTIVFYYSDHGDGLPRMKRWTYDSGIKVPFGVRFPDGSRAGETTDRLVSFVDFAPTALSLAGIPIPDYMQGKAFLGEQETEPREYVFASHDRMDPSLHCIRTVRNKRYKYIRNHLPDRPYIQFLPYRDQMPLMQEILKMKEEGTANEIQKLWLADTKPPEELYDLENDPHEINNLADHPEFQEIKTRLSLALDEWINMNNDPLTLPETEIIKNLWPPEGVQPQTQPVSFTETDGFINLSSATEGASIAYQVNDSIGKNHWRLFTEPVPVSEIDSLDAVAIRIGFKQSEVSRFMEQ